MLQSSMLRWPGAGLRNRVQRPALSVASSRSLTQSYRRRALGSVCAAAVQEDVASTSLTGKEVAIEQFPAPAPGAFTADRTSFVEEHRIRGYEVSPDQRANVVTIANLLQEVAGNHAVGMWGRTDAGFATLPSMKDLLFVMTRLQIRMLKYPKWGDIVSVETYFTEEGRLAARRDWKVWDSATGEVLGYATSTWVTINWVTRRLAKLPEDLRKRFLLLSPPPTQHLIEPSETKLKLPDISLPGSFQGPTQMARRSDMDMNGHINNVTYLAWALESVPEEVYNGCKLYQIEVDFKAECKAGNSVEVHCNPLPDVTNGNGAKLQFLHTLQRCDESGCTELVRARTTWTK